MDFCQQSILNASIIYIKKKKKLLTKTCSLEGEEKQLVCVCKIYPSFTYLSVSGLRKQPPSSAFL